jgi:hypothetical protein
MDVKEMEARITKRNGIGCGGAIQELLGIGSGP